MFLNLFSVSEGYWLKQSSASPYAGFLLQFFFLNFNFGEKQCQIILCLFFYFFYYNYFGFCEFWMRVYLTGSMYHGSPLLLAVLGPLTVKRCHRSLKLCSLVFLVCKFTLSCSRFISSSLSFGIKEPRCVNPILCSVYIPHLIFWLQ